MNSFRPPNKRSCRPIECSRNGAEVFVRIYSWVIFPYLCEWVLNRPWLAKYRRELLAQASGEVLEIGFGTALNLPYYPPGVRELTAVEPNPGMYCRARQRIKSSGIQVNCWTVSGEQLPFPDHSFACVVSTFTLCSIANAPRAIAEAYRVLKPSGRLLFLEHGLSPEPAVQKWQRRLNRLEMWLADGCRLDRNIRNLVAAQPFSSIEVQGFYIEKLPKTHGYMYRGIATQ